MKELKIQVEDERAGVRDVWRLTNPSELEPGWQHGQAKIDPVNPNIDYWVNIMALRSESANDGFASLDTFKYELLENIECETFPPFANPVVCPEGQFECASDHACLDMEKVCDFWKDCEDGSDEIVCPIEYLFENCAQDLCYWTEDPTDQLDWVIASGKPTSKIAQKCLVF